MNYSKILTTFFILTLIVRCSSLKHPPSQNFIKKVKMTIKEGHLSSIQDKKLSKGEIFSRDYLYASSLLRINNENTTIKKENKDINSKKACDIFQGLLTKQNFPAKETLLIKLVEACDNKDILTSIWNKELENISSWALFPFLQASLNKAIKLKLYDFAHLFAYKMSLKSTNLNEKQNLLSNAIKFVSKSSDKDNLTIKYKNKLNKIKKRNRKNYLSTGIVLERKRFFKKARSNYLKIINSKKYNIDEKIQAWNRLRLSHKLERNTKKYIKETEKLTDFIKKSATQNEDIDLMVRSYTYRIKLARIYWTQHQGVRSLKILNRLKKINNIPPSMKSQILQTIAAIQMEHKNYTEAINNFLKAKKFETYNDDLNWNVAWCYYLNSQFLKATDEFKMMRETTKNHYLKERILYWEGKSYAQLKMNEKAKNIFTRVKELDPYGYYGMLSSFEVNKKIHPIKINNDSSDLSLPIFNWLSALGERSLNRRYLSDYLNTNKSNKTIENLLPLFYQINSNDLGLFSFFSIKDYEEKLDILKSNVQYIYPIAYNDIVSNAADIADVPPSLILAIIRQESTFREKVRSHAEAYGLMQLIPERGISLAKQYNIPYKGVEDLLRPEINILMGALLLKQQLEIFNGDLVPAIASYNAKLSAVKHWLKTRFDGDYTKFIEMIPYSETKRYVKLVLRNYIMYERVLHDNNILPSFPHAISFESNNTINSSYAIDQF